jgi:hypothetical protein
MVAKIREMGSRYEFVEGQAGSFGEDWALASLAWTGEAPVAT